MLGEKKLRALTDQILSYSTADQTEALVQSEDSSLTRFANSFIHQNVHESSVDVRVRVVNGKRIGVATTNDLSEAGLRKVVASATAIARFQQDNPDFRSLPGPAASYPALTAFSENTAGATPEMRAQATLVICKKCIAAGVIGSGALTTAVSENVVANSLGVFAYFPTTRAELTTVAMSDTGSGYAHDASLDVAKLDVEALADEAVNKAIKSRNPIAVDAGQYPVILEEYAVHDFVTFLSYLGFSVQAVHEGRSFMKLGEKVVGDNISIWDDGLDPAGLPMPFDFEGVPKVRLPLIERGVAAGIVHDSYTAGRDGAQSTGHGLPAPNTFGPMPLNTMMATGKNTTEEMLRSTKKGIWVTRFWYTRPVHPLKIIVTGTTRDGTFLIEDGEITKPVRNFRFTQGYLEALSNVEMIGATAKTLTGMLGACRVPALKISAFNFTGVTQF
jgi:predicted Zn-dependent protease